MQKWEDANVSPQARVQKVDLTVFKFPGGGTKYPTTCPGTRVTGPLPCRLGVTQKCQPGIEPDEPVKRSANIERPKAARPLMPTVGDVWNRIVAQITKSPVSVYPAKGHSFVPNQSLWRVWGQTKSPYFSTHGDGPRRVPLSLTVFHNDGWSSELVRMEGKGQGAKK